MTTITTPEIIDKLRAAVADAGGMRAWSRSAGVSPTYTHMVLSGQSPPSERIAAALGYERLETRWKRASGNGRASGPRK